MDRHYLRHHAAGRGIFAPFIVSWDSLRGMELQDQLPVDPYRIFAFSQTINRLFDDGFQLRDILFLDAVTIDLSRRCRVRRAPTSSSDVHTVIMGLSADGFEYMNEYESPFVPGLYYHDFELLLVQQNRKRVFVFSYESLYPTSEILHILSSVGHVWVMVPPDCSFLNAAHILSLSLDVLLHTTLPKKKKRPEIEVLIPCSDFFASLRRPICRRLVSFYGYHGAYFTPRLWAGHARRHGTVLDHLTARAVRDYFDMRGRQKSGQHASQYNPVQVTEEVCQILDETPDPDEEDLQ